MMRMLRALVAKYYLLGLGLWQFIREFDCANTRILQESVDSLVAVSNDE